jgi:peptidase C13-like protein
VGLPKEPGARLSGRLPALALALAVASPASAEQSHLLIVVGLGGEQRFTDAFHELATSMVTAAENRLGVAAANVVYLGEKTPVRSTRENVLKAFEDITRRAGAGDLVFILLIGHGSFQSGEARFNLPGPDMSAADFAPLLARLASQKVVFVNTASASGDFVKALSGNDRAIVTATKSAFERNETEFARYFVEAFTTDGADADKDQRVSVLEAFDYARREVQRAYEKNQRLLTEHAVLDDHADGALARTLFLGSGPPAIARAADDPELAELRRQRRALEKKIDALKGQKESMAAARYDEELEKLLVELALTDGAIRRREAQK